MGWLTIKQWLKTPYLDIWRESAPWEEYTTFGDDARNVLGSISTQLLIKHHAGKCASKLEDWKVDADKYTIVDLGSGDAFSDKLDGIQQNIKDFITLFNDVLNRQDGENSAGKPCSRNPSPLPADIRLFKHIADETLRKLDAVDPKKKLAELRMIGFWVFNSPAFLVEGERELYIKVMWRLKDNKNYRFLFKGGYFDTKELDDWISIVENKDTEGYLQHIHAFVVEKDKKHQAANKGKHDSYDSGKSSNLIGFERTCYEHLEEMSPAQLELYLHDIFPSALSSIYRVLFKRYCDDRQLIDAIRRPTKPFSWGGT